MCERKKNKTMKKIKLTFLFIATLSLLLLSCGNQQEVTNDTIPAIPKAIIVTDFKPYANSAPYHIDAVNLVKNQLTINVTYSGGCEKHEFQLIGNRMISKSIPPQRSIQLYHNNNGDSCREQLTETLVFDISAFAYSDQEISLILSGYREVIPYIPIK